MTENETTATSQARDRNTAKTTLAGAIANLPNCQSASTRALTLLSSDEGKPFSQTRKPTS
jgi:hypothetical protein